MSTTVVISSEEASKIPPMTQKRINELKNRPIVFDEDSPKLTAKQLAEFCHVNKKEKHLV